MQQQSGSERNEDRRRCEKRDWIDIAEEGGRIDDEKMYKKEMEEFMSDGGGVTSTPCSAAEEEELGSGGIASSR